MIASASDAPHLSFKHLLQPLVVMLLWYSSHMLFFFPSWMNIFLWVTPTPSLYNVMPLVTCLSPVGFLNLIFQLPFCTLQSPASLFSFSLAPICPPLVRTCSLLVPSVCSCESAALLSWFVIFFRTLSVSSVQCPRTISALMCPNRFTQNSVCAEALLCAAGNHS